MFPNFSVFINVFRSVSKKFRNISHNAEISRENSSNSERSNTFARIAAHIIDSLPFYICSLFFLFFRFLFCSPAQSSRRVSRCVSVLAVCVSRSIPKSIAQSGSPPRISQLLGRALALSRRFFSTGFSRGFVLFFDRPRTEYTEFNRSN